MSNDRCPLPTVNSEMFTRVLFLRNGEITVVYWYMWIMPIVAIFNLANLCLNAIRENKILAKISEFTLFVLIGGY